jgi:hypothetical protein
VEEGGNRWSKPHVATLSLHSLFELRAMLTSGTVILDMEANNLEQVADLTIDSMASAGFLLEEQKEKVSRHLLINSELHLMSRDERKTQCSIILSSKLSLKIELLHLRKTQDVFKHLQSCISN